MDRHTPGPWSVDDYGAGQRIVVKGRQGFSGDYRVADAHFSSDLANCVRVAEMQANARLIAAAPELLEWGAELLTLLDDYMQVTSLTANLRYAVALGMFRKAIAKAEGRQSTSMEGGRGMSETDPYSPEIVAEADAYPSLGAEYFAAREASERFMAMWRDEHAEKFAEEIMKPVMDLVTERVWDAFRDHLISDTTANLQSEMQRMVERSVIALIGGDKWANVKYIQPPYHDGQKVRETLAKLYSDEIKDGRIADLEREVERLTVRLRERF